MSAYIYSIHARIILCYIDEILFRLSILPSRPGKLQIDLIPTTCSRVAYRGMYSDDDRSALLYITKVY
jgi:hypothetical protein